MNDRWKGIVIHPAVRIIAESIDGYAATFKDLKFIVSVGREDDGKLWLHSSVSRRDRKLPTYDDLKTLKTYVVGEHRTALQVFPPAEKYIDFSPVTGIEVLHLWACLDGDVTPDFARGGKTI